MLRIRLPPLVLIPLTVLFPLLMIGLLPLATPVRIACEYSAPDWRPDNTYRLSAGEVMVTTRYGFDMVVDVTDQTVSKSIREKGIWQSAPVHVLALFLQPGMRVLNLGPQTGLEAILMGRIIGPQGSLHLFEPYAPSYAILKKNIHLNGLADRSRLFKVGAGDEQAEQKVLVFPENTGAAELYSLSTFPSEDLAHREYASEVVRMDLVDNVLPVAQVLDFVLMDVERMEVAALLGMRRVIERSAEGLVLLVEWSYKVNPRRQEGKTVRCLQWLRGLQFRFYEHQPKVQCRVGTFREIEDVMDLLSMEPLDLLIVPAGVDPNQLAA